MPVKQLFGKEAREALYQGAEKLNNAVSVTLGPAGRNNLFRHFNMVISTKDGVTVAEEINLPDTFESIGADLIKQAARQSVNEAGDGTTTATLLATMIFKAGIKAIDTEGIEPVGLVRGIERATREIIGIFDRDKKKYVGGYLETLAVETTPELAFHAAKISSNGDEKIAKVVSEAVLSCGVEGALTVGNSNSQEHLWEKVPGMQLDAGMVHPYFVNDPQRARAVYEDCTVILLNRRLSTVGEATRLMELALKSAMQQGRPRSILVLCDDIDNEALQHCLMNKTKNEAPVPVVIVRTPLWATDRSNILDDLASMIGGKRIEAPHGKDYADLNSISFGVARRVEISMSKTLIVGYEKQEAEQKKRFERQLQLIQTIVDDENQTPDQVDIAKRRKAVLAGGVAVIKVGGSGVADVGERKFRVEDAIHATRAAVSDGVVPGGGSALHFAGVRPGFRCAMFSTDAESAGFYLLHLVLSEPLKKIASNAGLDGEKIAEDVWKLWDERGLPRNGFNAATGEYSDDMIRDGIVDPLRVVRCALNAATSAAATLLKTECVIGHYVEHK